MFSKSKKYSCVFCSNKSEKSNKIIFFCRECNKIRDYIRDKGIKTLLNKIEEDNSTIPPTAPPYK